MGCTAQSTKYISNLYHTEYLYALACPKVERC